MTDKYHSCIPSKKNDHSVHLIQFHNVPFILAPKLVIRIRDDGEEHGGGSFSTWHQDPLGAHHCIAYITIFIWWANFNLSPPPSTLIFKLDCCFLFQGEIRCPFWSEAIVRRAQMITLVSAFKKRNFFAQPMTWCDCSFFSKALNLAWTSTIWLTILFSLIKTNQSSLASISKAPLSLFLLHSVAAALFPPLQLFFLFICHR